MRKRRRADVRNTTALEVAYLRSGSMLVAARVLAFITAWGVVRDELGRTPTMDEYIERWGEKRSTAYKHLGEFREVFDRCEWPDPVLDRMAVGDSGRLDASGLAAA